MRPAADVRLAAADAELAARLGRQPHVAAAARIESPGNPLERIRVVARLDDSVLHIEPQCLRLAAPVPSGAECVMHLCRAIVAAPELQPAALAPRNITVRVRHAVAR